MKSFEFTCKTKFAHVLSQKVILKVDVIFTLVLVFKSRCKKYFKELQSKCIIVLHHLKLNNDGTIFH